MSLVIPFIVIIIIHQIHSIPKYIFSLRNDYHDLVRQLLYMNCSFPTEYSPLFICSNEIFYHVEFNIDISLAPFQSKLNKCAIIIKYSHISVYTERINQSAFLTSHDNYCSFQLLPIGSKCSFILQIKPYNVSCYLNLKLSKYDQLENNKKKSNTYIYIINKTDITQPKNQFNQNLFAFFITIFMFTLIPLILFIRNVIYIKRSPTNIPYYLKHYDIQSDISKE